MERIICLAMGYVFGLFQTGYLYGRYRGIDIRSLGSGNSGSTNALRVMGARAGLVVFLGDLLKTMIPCLLARVLFQGSPDYTYVWILYTGFGVVLGHNFPIYLKFKGGKGIAATAGIITSLDWRLMLLCLGAFVLVVAVTRYVSLGSLIVSSILLVWNVVMGQLGAYGLSPASRPEFYLMSGVIAAMAFWRHRANIVRLARGGENKIGSKKSENGR